MKKLVYLLSILAVVACKSKNDKEQVIEETSSYAEELSTPATITDWNKLALTEENEEMLLGMIDRKGLQREQFKPWVDSIYNDYSVDTTIVGKIKPLLGDIDIRIFMGTWCEDSQREIPALFKVLDETNFNEENLYLTAVNRQKVTPQGLENGYNIEYVPTIILLDGNTELGRIVEYPIESLEKDLHSILSGDTYKHAYED
jgi:thiol-disulfide isomerase/thioredoxin